jgi:hypothetical protein
MSKALIQRGESMNEPTAGVVRKRKSILRRVLDAWQICVAITLSLLVLVVATNSHADLPGVPIALLWATIATGVVLALGQLSPVFWSVPRNVVGGLYLGTLAFLALWLTTAFYMQEAWGKTPEGAAEARAREEIERVNAMADEVDRVRAARRQQAQAAEQDRQERAEKLEGCFSMFGHRLPDLEQQVKDSLGNPDSFEHVKTEAMPTDADGYDVLMRFRAQNRMGALWTWSIRAAVDPASCSISDIEAEPSEG